MKCTGVQRIMEPSAFSPIQLTWAEATLRIGASMLLPTLIGIDRFLPRKPIDFPIHDRRARRLRAIANNHGAGSAQR